MYLPDNFFSFFIYLFIYFRIDAEKKDIKLIAYHLYQLRSDNEESGRASSTLQKNASELEGSWWERQLRLKNLRRYGVLTQVQEIKEVNYDAMIEKILNSDEKDHVVDDDDDDDDDDNDIDDDDIDEDLDIGEEDEENEIVVEERKKSIFDDREEEVRCVAFII
jgi:hypothetical protein